MAWENILEDVDAKLLLVSHTYVQQKVARQAVVLRHLLGLDLFEVGFHQSAIQAICQSLKKASNQIIINQWKERRCCTRP